MLFRLVDAPWKIVLMTLVLILSHAAWFRSGHEPVVIQRCGAALIMLGVLVAARGFLREGLDAAVNRQLPRSPFAPYYSEEIDKQWREKCAELRPEIERDVRAERGWAFRLITIGTALNGYGDLSACLFGRFL
jgi:hypothetical protein